jgi:hypothetical protein
VRSASLRACMHACARDHRALNSSIHTAMFLRYTFKFALRPHLPPGPSPPLAPPPPMTADFWFDLCSSVLARPAPSQLLILRVAFGTLIALSALAAATAAFIAYRHRKFKQSTPNNALQFAVWSNFPYFVSLVLAASCVSCVVWAVYVDYLGSFFQLKSDALDHLGPQYVLRLGRCLSLAFSVK